MNLHDWIDELSDLLDVDTEADEGLLGDLADVVVENVDQHAGPVTAFLLGVAAGAQSAGPEKVERLAARVQALAEAWDRPADAIVAEDEEVEVEAELDDLDELELDEEEEDVVV